MEINKRSATLSFQCSLQIKERKPTKSLSSFYRMRREVGTDGYYDNVNFSFTYGTFLEQLKSALNSLISGLSFSRLFTRVRILLRIST